MKEGAFLAVAIIAEYNPFHNGHIYQLKIIKEKFPNEQIYVFLSGKYVQRGEIAVVNYHDRKQMALNYGASKVIPIPFSYSTQAAHLFADGAIKMVAQLKIDKLVFGSESSNIDNLVLIAKTIFKCNSQYNSLLKSYLKKGLSFPRSNSNALFDLIGQEIVMSNDILALEYVKSIIKHNFPITPIAIKRIESSNTISSATKLRQLILDHQPINQFSPIKINDRKIEKIEDYYPRFQKIVRETDLNSLANIKLVSEGMENLFKKNIDLPTYKEFVNKTNSKRYTSSRIKRVILYVLLQIPK